MSKKRHNTSSGLKSSPEHIELKRLKALVTQLKKENELLINELERIRSFSRKHIDKALLEKHIREGKTNKQLAKIFKVSTRTIARRVKEYRLKGLRKPGKRKLKTLIQSEDKGNWISVERYMDKLNRKYNFANVQYPHTKYINERTKVCSNFKGNPQGQYTTSGIYYVVQVSGVYFLYRTRIRYSDEPVEFDEIHNWTKRNAKDILANMWLENQLTVVDIVAYTFLNPESKPESVVVAQEVSA